MAERRIVCNANVEFPRMLSETSRCDGKEQRRGISPRAVTSVLSEISGFLKLRACISLKLSHAEIYTEYCTPTNALIIYCILV